MVVRSAHKQDDATILNGWCRAAFSGYGDGVKVHGAYYYRLRFEL